MGTQQAVASITREVLPLVEIAYGMTCPSCGGEADVVLRDEPKYFGQGIFNCGHCGRHATLKLRFISALPTPKG